MKVKPKKVMAPRRKARRSETRSVEARVPAEVSVKKRKLENGSEVPIAVVIKNPSFKRVKGKRAVISCPIASVATAPYASGLLSDDLLNMVLTKPVGWPMAISWRPTRYFGPFWEGSDLSQIEISVNGTSVAWYYNDFFVGNSDNTSFQPYFSGSLPTTKRPAEQLNPGTYPGSDGLGVFVCELERIAYSSRYGGSVELAFRAKSDVGFEIRRGGFLWDLTDLQILVYVSPYKTGFQGGAAAYTQGVVVCEAKFSSAVCYSIPISSTYSTPATPLLAQSDVHQSELEQALTMLSQTVSPAIKATALSFVYGYIHLQYPELTGSSKVVESLIISDNVIDIVSREVIPFVYVQFRVKDIHSYGDTNTLDDDMLVRLSSDIVFAGGIVHGPHDNETVKQHHSTGWLTVGDWNLVDEAPQVSSILLRVNGAETDWPDADDTFETYEMQVTLDLNELTTSYNNGTYGVVESSTYYAMQDFVGDSGPPGVFFNVDVRVLLVAR